MGLQTPLELQEKLPRRVRYEIDPLGLRALIYFNLGGVYSNGDQLARAEKAFRQSLVYTKRLARDGRLPDDM